MALVSLTGMALNCKVLCNHTVSARRRSSLYMYHPRRAVVLLDTGTPGTSTEIYSEDADDGTRTRNASIMFKIKKGLTTPLLAHHLLHPL